MIDCAVEVFLRIGLSAHKIEGDIHSLLSCCKERMVGEQFSQSVCTHCHAYESARVIGL